MRRRYRMWSDIYYIKTFREENPEKSYREKLQGVVATGGYNNPIETPLSEGGLNIALIYYYLITCIIYLRFVRLL